MRTAIHFARKRSRQRWLWFALAGSKSLWRELLKQHKRAEYGIGIGAEVGINPVCGVAASIEPVTKIERDREYGNGSCGNKNLILANLKILKNKRWVRLDVTTTMEVASAPGTKARDAL